MEYIYLVVYMITYNMSFDIKFIHPDVYDSILGSYAYWGWLNNKPKNNTHDRLHFHLYIIIVSHAHYKSNVEIIVHISIIRFDSYMYIL